ncbi:MAG: sugar phosphate isomerase/epimerase [Clostridia bacterium]|nr:sugar phosphate isomerase/epimerase [Clostridia bacterium]
MNKLGIFLNFWEQTWAADHAKYVRKAAKLGFDVLEFQAQALLELSDSRLDELKALAVAEGVELTYSLGLDKAYDISSSDPAIREGGIEYLSAIMDKVAYMGGRIISGVSYAGWGVPDGDFDKEELFANSVASMKVLGAKAASLGITYGIEVVNRFEGVLLNTAAEAVKYVEAVGLPNVGILLDTYHMNIEEESIGGAIRLVGDKLVGFHVGENNRTCPGCGKGHLDWDEIFGALKTIGYTGRIVAEPFVTQGGEVGRSIYVWRNLLEDVSEAALDAEAATMLAFENAMLVKWGM